MVSPHDLQTRAPCIALWATTGVCPPAAGLLLAPWFTSDRPLRGDEFRAGNVADGSIAATLLAGAVIWQLTAKSKASVTSRGQLTVDDLAWMTAVSRGRVKTS